MSINTNLRTDYSSLFSSLSAGSSGSSSNLFSSISLTDYNTIKSGSYYKLLKAYYAKNTADSTQSTSSTKKLGTNSVSDASEVKADASTMYNAASKLTTTGTKSLFNEKEITQTAEDGTKTTTTGYDTASIKSAVKDFVQGYNELISSAGSSSNSSTSRVANSMVNLTNVFSNQLSKVGITVGTDNKLSLDESAFDEADMNTVKTLFNGSNSYADHIGAYASTIGAYANADLNAGNTYNQYGSYSSLQSGINYSSFF